MKVLGYTYGRVSFVEGAKEDLYRATFGDNK